MRPSITITDMALTFTISTNFPHPTIWPSMVGNILITVTLLFVSNSKTFWVGGELEPYEAIVNFTFTVFALYGTIVAA